MTNEELIQDMKDHIARGEYEGYALTNEECIQVIQALEQQPCDDAISRQALIEKATSWDKHFADSE